MECENCGNHAAHRMRFHEDGTCVCDRCGLTGTMTLPDVYFDGKPEKNLADDPATGKAKVFATKGEKAAYLKARGIRESGDRVHGAPISALIKTPRQDSRQQVKSALEYVKRMPSSIRHQEYLKIMKTGERFR